MSTNKRKDQDENLEEQSGQDQSATTVMVTGDGINICKAKIKEDLFLNVEYTQTVNDFLSEHTDNRKQPVHNDLKAVFSKLDHHLARLCEQYDYNGDFDIHSITCKGFTIGGSDETEGVCLVGRRELESGKTLNLVTPFTRWSDEYEHIGELSQAIEECKHEVKLYLFEGKRQPDAQQEIPFPEGDDYGEANR